MPRSHGRTVPKTKAGITRPTKTIVNRQQNIAEVIK